MSNLEIKVLSSLDKVFYDGPSDGIEFSKGSCLIGEKYAFQFAFRGAAGLDITLESSSPKVKFYKVEQMPAKLTVTRGHDDDILKGTPGFFPDLLVDAENHYDVYGTDAQWYAIWCEFETKEKMLESVETLITVKEKYWDGSLSEGITKKFTLEVINQELPKQDVIVTQWFHTDCLRDYYQEEAFSPRLWDLIEKFINNTTEHGQNMILTPIFTPALDTNVGKERSTVQLVGIKKVADQYQFDFSNLNKWSKICQNAGIEYLEIPHFYTQWGANAAPKIEVEIDGKVEKYFGWHTDAMSDEYQEFLTQFIGALIEWLDNSPWKNKAYFHTSDEPSDENIDQYRKTSKFLKSLIHDYPMSDALSDFEFYKQGLVDIPIAGIDSMAPFIEHNSENLWTYYCVGHNKKVSNRFFDMPSYRNRILGYQLYKYDVKGFLQWAYNFWNWVGSDHPINPFEITDAGGWLSAGDAFIVYPGEEGPLSSLRQKVFHQGIQDTQALKLLEQKKGKEFVINMLEKGIDPITFEEYPRDLKWQVEKREEINQLIKEF